MTPAIIRDPRLNPVPGDTLQKGNSFRTVYWEGLVEKRGVHKHGVAFVQHNRPYARPGAAQRKIGLKQWRVWAFDAEVLRRESA